MILKLAWRNIWRHKRRTAITVMSIAVGLGLGLFFTGIADGAYGRLIATAVKLGSGHLVLEHPSYRDDPSFKYTLHSSPRLIAAIEALPHVTGCTPRISGPAMLSTSYGTVGGSFDAVIPGIDRNVSLIPRYITEGTYLSAASPGGIVIGTEVARKLNADLGGKIVMTTQNRSNETVQELFRVTGIFHTKSDILDGFYCQISLEKAQKMLGYEPGEVLQIGIFLDSHREERGVRQALEQLPAIRCNRLALVSWQTILSELANHITVDTASNYLFQILLFLVILAGVLNTILMSVMERTYEFGVMLALGLKRGKLLLLILVETCFLGLLGVLAGSLLTWAENAWFYRHPIDLSSLVSEDMTVSGFFMEPDLIMNLYFSHFVWTIGIAFLLIMIVGLYPAGKAARLAPVEALQARK